MFPKLSYSNLPLGCEFSPGDGDVKEDNLGVFENEEECISQCVERKKTYPEINGVTVDSASGKKCYCKYSLTKSKLNKESQWKTCILDFEHFSKCA